MKLRTAPRIKCPECHSTKTYKLGHREDWVKGKKIRRQAWQCQACGHQWRQK